MKYFIEGGPLFMGILTLLLLAIFVVSGIGYKSAMSEEAKGSFNFGIIKSLGLLALVVGMLGQFIGLFSAFEAIGGGMQVSPQIMASGVKVSMISSIYGMIIFVISYLLWFGIKFIKK